MIKSNIRIAIITILGMIVFWLLMFFVIKIDVSVQTVVFFQEGYSYVAIDEESAAYIDNKDIDYVKMEYNKQYFNCHITYSTVSGQTTYYFITLPDVVDRTVNHFTTNIVIDSLNVYNYWLKK